MVKNSNKRWARGIPLVMKIRISATETELRQNPSSSSKLIEMLQPNDRVLTAVEVEKGWYRISELNGWVEDKDVTIIEKIQTYDENSDMDFSTRDIDNIYGLRPEDILNMLREIKIPSDIIYHTDDKRFVILYDMLQEYYELFGSLKDVGDIIAGMEQIPIVPNGAYNKVLTVDDANKPVWSFVHWNNITGKPTNNLVIFVKNLSLLDKVESPLTTNVYYVIDEHEFYYYDGNEYKRNNFTLEKKMFDLDKKVGTYDKKIEDMEILVTALSQKFDDLETSYMEYTNSKIEELVGIDTQSTGKKSFKVHRCSKNGLNNVINKCGQDINLISVVDSGELYVTAATGAGQQSRSAKITDFIIVDKFSSLIHEILDSDKLYVVRETGAMYIYKNESFTEIGPGMDPGGGEPGVPDAIPDFGYVDLSCNTDGASKTIDNAIESTVTNYMISAIGTSEAPEKIELQFSTTLNGETVSETLSLQFSKVGGAYRLKKRDTFENYYLGGRFESYDATGVVNSTPTSVNMNNIPIRFKDGGVTTITPITKGDYKITFFYPKNNAGVQALLTDEVDDRNSRIGKDIWYVKSEKELFETITDSNVDTVINIKPGANILLAGDREYIWPNRVLLRGNNSVIDTSLCKNGLVFDGGCSINEVNIYKGGDCGKFSESYNVFTGELTKETVTNKTITINTVKTSRKSSMDKVNIIGLATDSADEKGTYGSFVVHGDGDLIISNCNFENSYIIDSVVGKDSTGSIYKNCSFSSNIDKNSHNRAVFYNYLVNSQSNIIGCTFDKMAISWGSSTPVIIKECVIKSCTISSVLNTASNNICTTSAYGLDDSILQDTYCFFGSSKNHGYYLNNVKMQDKSHIFFVNGPGVSAVYRADIEQYLDGSDIGYANKASVKYPVDDNITCDRDIIKNITLKNVSVGNSSIDALDDQYIHFETPVVNLVIDGVSSTGVYSEEGAKPSKIVLSFHKTPHFRNGNNVDDDGYGTINGAGSYVGTGTKKYIIENCTFSGINGCSIEYDDMVLSNSIKYNNNPGILLINEPLKVPMIKSGNIRNSVFEYQYNTDVDNVSVFDLYGSTGDFIVEDNDFKFTRPGYYIKDAAKYKIPVIQIMTEVQSNKDLFVAQLINNRFDNGVRIKSCGNMSTDNIGMYGNVNVFGELGSRNGAIDSRCDITNVPSDNSSFHNSWVRNIAIYGVSKIVGDSIIPSGYNGDSEGLSIIKLELNGGNMTEKAEIELPSPLYGNESIGVYDTIEPIAGELYYIKRIDPNTNLALETPVSTSLGVKEIFMSTKGMINCEIQLSVANTFAIPFKLACSFPNTLEKHIFRIAVKLSEIEEKDEIGDIEKDIEKLEVMEANAVIAVPMTRTVEDKYMLKMQEMQELMTIMNKRIKSSSALDELITRVEKLEMFAQKMVSAKSYIGYMTKTLDSYNSDGDAKESIRLRIAALREIFNKGVYAVSL